MLRLLSAVLAGAVLAGWQSVPVPQSAMYCAAPQAACERIEACATDTAEAGRIDRQALTAAIIVGREPGVQAVTEGCAQRTGTLEAWHAATERCEQGSLLGLARTAHSSDWSCEAPRARWRCVANFAHLGELGYG